MKETKKTDDSIYYEKVPGSGGLFSTIFFAIFGTLVIIWTLCYATNFICEFVGIDFNAFIWVRQFYYDLPDMFAEWLEILKGLLSDGSAAVQ